MATDKEERAKYYSPYTDPTLVRAQSRQNASVAGMVRAATQVADQYLGGAGGRQIGRGLRQVGDRIVSDFQRGRDAASVRDNRANAGQQSVNQAVENDAQRQPAPARSWIGSWGAPASAASPPAPPLVEPPMVRSSPGIVNPTARGVQQQPSSGPLRLSFRDNNTMFRADGSLNVDPAELAAFKQRDQAMRAAPQQGIRQDGSRQVGNMDVIFAPGTDQAAIQRFMAQPVAPGTRRVPGLGMVDPGRGRAQDSPPQDNSLGGFLARGLRAREAQAYAGIDDARRRTDLTGRGQDLDYDVARTRNLIDAQDVGSQIGLRREQASQIAPNAESQRTLNEAMTRESGVRSDTGRFLETRVPTDTGEVDELGAPIFKDRTVYIDPNTRQRVDSMGGASYRAADAEAAVAELSKINPEAAAQVNAYFTDRMARTGQRATPDEIIAYIEALGQGE